EQAFTMAEILLSLTIIGVVAAITLPSLTGNINERTWNTQRKALYARFSQAIALMPALNGYGTLDGTTDTAAETFVTSGLSKVLKMNNICDSDHLEDCGIPARLTTIAGSVVQIPRTLVSLNTYFNASMAYSNGVTMSYSQLDTKAAAFETANGESILTYYNPNCVSAMGETTIHYIQPKMCVNFIFDLNGTKGPNTVGKDIGFMTVFYPTDSLVVAPMPLNHRALLLSDWHSAVSTCRQQDEQGRVPNIDELAAMFVNRYILNEFVGESYWSSSKFDANNFWVFEMYSGRKRPWASNDSRVTLHCIKRY
ncbi:MAG: prepilin-type N-terminal cleavage/methylation domain-containing protein, partial [Fusobacterium sp.]|nr:prepilin-type N-terminal cleavage/methylation domain-containing protein [Fusobacterium sp.]